MIVFFAAQVLPGDPARAILGPLAAAVGGARADHQLGTDTSLIHAVPDLDRPPAHWQPGHLVHLPGADRTDPGHRARQLAEAGRARLHPRRPAWDRLRRDRRAQLGQARSTARSASSDCRRPRSRRWCGDRADPGIRDLAQHPADPGLHAAGGPASARRSTTSSCPRSRWSSSCSATSSRWRGPGPSRR